MKKVIKAVVFVLGLAVLCAGALLMLRRPAEQRPLPQLASFNSMSTAPVWPALDLAAIPVGHKEAFFKVKGLSGRDGGSRAADAVAALAGVDSARADSSTGVVSVVFNPAAVSAESIQNAITGAGYLNAGRGQAGVWSRTRLDDQSVRLALEVHGMTCSGCSSGLAAELKKLPGVSAAEADAQTMSCVVEYRPAETTEEAIAAAIRAQGYTLGSDADAAGPPSKVSLALMLNTAKAQS